MKRKRFFSSMMCILTIWFIGCAGQAHYGSFVPESTAKSFFETYSVSSDYKYYITGSDTYPVALLALQAPYKMDNDLWKSIELTPASMEQLITNMQLQLRNCCYQNQFGFQIYDPKGKPIGMLYSYLGVGLTFRVDDDGTVWIAGPRDDDQLKSYQGRVGRSD